MDAPEPRKQIVVEEGELLGHLALYCANLTMVNWIKEHAPRFGIFSDDLLDNYGYYSLTVNPCFEFSEVIDYLTNGWKKDDQA